jgi:tRNA (guanine37-N1)-methyltransferase
VDDELSIGDYVLTNGAIAAAVMVDAIARLIPGVLGGQSLPGTNHFPRVIGIPPIYPTIRFPG